MDIASAIKSPTQNPFAALKKLIEQEQIAADALVSCGDMTDKALPEATAYVWDAIKRIGADLGATEIVATTGNHDLDSRHRFNDFDAKGILMGLGDYPFADDQINNEYWARNVVVLSRNGYRYVVLNSAAYHGYSDEHEHGRVARSTVDHLRQTLSGLDTKATNILVCHHHLSKTGAYDLADSSEMTNSGILLELLSSTEYGRWLVLHGHRHWPYLNYADGGGSSPVIFSAGSLAAVVYDEIHDKARNQFYVIELELDNPGGPVMGSFKAWDWTNGVGFGPAQEDSGLPYHGGFGHREGGDTIADAMINALDRCGETYLTRNGLLAAVPMLDYVAPQDLLECKKILRSRGLSVLEDQGRLEQIGRRD